MDQANLTTAQQLAQAASAFHQRRTGHLPESVTVVLSENRLVIALVVVGGLIGSSLIGIFAKNGPFVFGVNVLSFIGFVLSGVLGLWLLWGVVRSGRL